MINLDDILKNLSEERPILIFSMYWLGKFMKNFYIRLEKLFKNIGNSKP